MNACEARGGYGGGEKGRCLLQVRYEKCVGGGGGGGECLPYDDVYRCLCALA